jgi:hypothetical protein
MPRRFIRLLDFITTIPQISRDIKRQCFNPYPDRNFGRFTRGFKENSDLKRAREHNGFSFIRSLDYHFRHLPHRAFEMDFCFIYYPSSFFVELEGMSLPYYRNPDIRCFAQELVSSFVRTRLNEQQTALSFQGPYMLCKHEVSISPYLSSSNGLYVLPVLHLKHDCYEHILSFIDFHQQHSQLLVHAFGRIEKEYPYRRKERDIIQAEFSTQLELQNRSLS